jgi:hypothetical protein
MVKYAAKTCHVQVRIIIITLNVKIHMDRGFVE